MKILFGIAENTARGGVNACEPPFIEAVQNLPNFEITQEVYVFDNREEPGVLVRLERIIRTAFKFRKLIKTNKFDVVHLNTAFDFKTVIRDFITLTIAKTGNTKFFLKLHGSESNLLQTNNLIKNIFIRKFLKMIDSIGVLSTEERDNFVRFGVDIRKLFVVKNSVVKAKNNDNDFQRNFDPKTIKLLFVSRLLFTKGLIETVKATINLHETNSKITLEVLGEGEALETAMDLVNRANADSYITFHRHISEIEVNEFYRHSDILVFPTFHIEGFPMVIFNAVSFGLPIITTKIRAAADYLKNEKNCLFCESKNPESVAECILKLIENKNLRKTMSENNRKLGVEFHAEKIAEEYAFVYKTISSK
jgi:glycosyltransferase involved in cell wall biosynthesis